MEKYHSYKSSSIDWIGEIPFSWDCGKMKYVLSNNDGGVWGTDIEDGELGTLVVRSTEITIDGNWDLSQILKRKLTESEVIKCKLFEGDIVITKSSGSPQHIGKSVIVNKEIENLNCCYSNFVQRIRFKDYNSKLYHYILNSVIVREQFKYLTTSSTGLGNLNGTSLNDILLPFIPLSEQLQIVHFLDLKTEVIDLLISTKERKITLLKEQRTSIINQVVTKGLNPNVKLKDSGVEWIGEIPEHWVTSRLDFLCDLKGRVGWKSLKSDEYVDEGFIFLSTPNIKNKDIDYNNVNYITEERYLESPEIMLSNGDVLLVKDGSTLGIVNIVKNLPSPSTVNSSIGVLKNKSDKLKPEFLFHFLTSHYCQNIINRMKGGMGVPHLFQSDIKKFRIFLPSISEQLLIIEYLDNKTKEIDELVHLEQKKIDLLKEYRQSLISEVVTGKIKVTTDE